MDIIFLLGRILFGGMFLAFGIIHIKRKNEMIKWMRNKKISNPEFINTLSYIILIFSGSMLVLGIFSEIAAVLLIIFLITATIKMHDFWNIKEKDKRLEQMIFAMYNLMLIGSNLIIIWISYWPLSL